MINIILIGDVIQKLKEIPFGTVNTCVTSPPYWGLRDYGVSGQIGLEKTPKEYVTKLVKVFREVWRVLRDDGTLWLNLGDSYASSPAGNFGPDMSMPANGGKFRENKPKMDYKKAGLKPKDLVGIPWMVAFALRADGWYLRQDIIWHKPNPMPESVKDRCTKAHEYIFLLSKSQKYYYDYEAIKEPASYNTNERVARSKIGQKSIPTEWHNGIRPRKVADTGSYIKNNLSFDAALNKMPDTRNKRSVWTVTSKPFSGAHFATFPPDLIEPCIIAGSPKDGIVLDPFFGAGTTGIVSLKNGRNYIGIELNPEYAELAENRIKHGTVDPEELEIIEYEQQMEMFK